MQSSGQRAIAVIAETLAELEIDHEQSSPGVFSVTLPGTRKLKTECALVVGRHTVEVRAFVARHPEENHQSVYRWLLETNLRLRQVAFAVDHHGDIHLAGRLPVDGLTGAEIDTVLGTVAETADSSFNTILELGFASGIAAEWAWRRSRGESTANLAAFTHLDPTREDR